ncbi:Uncharacterized protein ESCO_006839 [Escovopsis weberi]|uniref:Transcriptional regulator n=1 Tax=Escovopsis weberi TaxID=150374 RepID=A0A0M8N634_ESCWE|nr:Uncharacterized protein ESCO_006839 [Escovopsis weberi]
MYLRDVHAEGDIPTLHQLIRENPLGILTTAIRSPAHPFIQSSHVPFVLDVVDEEDADRGESQDLGILRGHLARQNPQSKAMMQSVHALSDAPPSLHPLPAGDVGSGVGASRVLEDEVMVLFNTPVHHYVTPKFYVETKPQSGKVVPTWNYAAAQVYGKARIYFETASPETADFLSRQVHDLSLHAETSIMGHTGVDSAPTPWAVSDAPDRYIQLLQKAIIGVEIRIQRLEGKFKMSQEVSNGDREGVVQGFASMRSDVGSSMSSIVRERGRRQEKGTMR